MTAARATADRTASEATTSATAMGARRSSLRQRLVAALVSGVIRVVRRLPDGVVHRLAHAVGVALFLVQPRRRTLVRANLERISAWLVDQGRASPRVAAAARDPRRMSALVRDAFGHYVRAYAEAAFVPTYGARQLTERIDVESPGTVVEALRPAESGGRGRIVIGLHFGAVELAARYAVVHGNVPVSGPMETIADPALQEVVLRTRAATGVRLLPLGSAATELRAALGRDEIVALVGDRMVRTGGTPVELFGATTRLPIGPAVLARQSGARVYLVAVRRTGWARYAARMSTIDLPPSAGRGSLRRLLEAEARVFESFVAEAPEQWWTIFFPIWGDAGAVA
jgi:phosphatidylinositol dimannoside acyltransferase